MKLFCKNSSIKDVRLGSKYVSAPELTICKYQIKKTKILFLLMCLPSSYLKKTVRFHDLKKAIRQSYLLIHNSFLVVLRSTTYFKRKKNLSVDPGE